MGYDRFARRSSGSYWNRMQRPGATSARNNHRSGLVGSRNETVRSTRRREKQGVPIQRLPAVQSVRVCGGAPGHAMQAIASEEIACLTKMKVTRKSNELSRTKQPSP